MVRNLDYFALNRRELTGGEASDDANGFGATGADFGCGSAQNQPILDSVRFVLSKKKQRLSKEKVETSMSEDYRCQAKNSGCAKLQKPWRSGKDRADDDIRRAVANKKRHNYSPILSDINCFPIEKLYKNY